ncbi:VIT1/CCC1 transporter family protein [Niabella drilacis]|uniref:VIT family protein n=1 Tax=Niabella drilacis (strain DSM 25811 / CCM 8410 / CCUG 62505 / LMG 26954 / E90) TaxID=1285928 RepID=A0A1G6ZJY3_NIADE|nr:VIT1/CCC1 transporter family protein [Niabella drilacis]SDE01866.1 VIT family protein [Niabella drilacis]
MSKITTHYFSSVLIGVIDGIIIPLTVFCFLSGLDHAASDVRQYTFYATLAAATLMAAGGFFTRREELSHTHDKRILNVYKGLDVADHIKEDLIKDAERESSEWKTEWEQKGTAGEPLPPLSYALCIFAGCIAGGLTILLNAQRHSLPGYLFFLNPAVILIITGFLKYRLFGRPVWGGVILTAGGGLLAAAGAYWIGTLI